MAYRMWRRRTTLFLLIGLGLLSVASVAAAPLALVEELQMPAWLERGGDKLPLRAGIELLESDVLETGKAGRFQIQFCDGSVLKVGEQARLSVDMLKAPMGTASTFEAFFDIVKGSFHLVAEGTAGAVGRDIGVRMDATIIDVRQANICGQASVEADVVCLIGGAIAVQHPAVGSFTMDQPRTVFVAPKGDKPTPVAPADPEIVAAWLAGTDRVAGQGITIPEGGWVVQLAAVEHEQTARAMAQRLAQAGYPVDLTTTEVNGRTFYRLRVDRFDSQLEARGFAGRIKGQFGVTDPWVTQLTARGAGN